MNLRHAVLIILLLTLTAANSVTGGTASRGFARLQYDGGGDWYNDPEVLPNLSRYANSVLNTNFPIDQTVVRATDPRLFDYPFVFMTGHGNIRFSERELENLRDWLLRGGFLYADDDYGMDAAFRREIKRVFPEYDLIELDSTFPLFTSFYDFGGGLPKIHKHNEKPPQAFGIFDPNGRLIVLYTYETNISDGWADYETHKNPPQVRETALRFGVNIVYYILARPS